MACSSTYSPAMLSARSLLLPSQTSISLKKATRWGKATSTRLSSVIISASTTDDTEECAPDKEVGKVSVEWLAGDKTKVVGTFPPKKKGWTGYVEKDTAGQTNIYSVEPAVYVAESAISSGAAGTSSEGAENTVAVVAGLALVSVAAAASILLQVDKTKPQVQSEEYSGPPLSYYISKFQSANIVGASTVPEPQTAPSAEAPAPPEATDSSTVEASTPSETRVTSDVQS